MDAPLWTETHAPSLDELPQPEVRDRLRRAVDQPLNLVVQGPPGVGKTAAVRAMARAAHAEPEADLLELNVADFFERSKKEIREDPRFEQFLRGQTEFSKQYRRGSGRNRYKRDWSKRDMIGHVLVEYAAHAPSTGAYKTLLLDNAEAIREDFQQALRRTMERHHRTTQFVIATRQPTKLIPAIRSRCFPVPVRAPTTAELTDLLARLCEREGVAYDPDGLQFVAGYADGDLRRAVLATQTTAVAAGEEGVTMAAARAALDDVGHDDRLRAILADARAGAFGDARDAVDDLLDDAGYDGGTLLRELLRVARREYDGADLARLHRLAGAVDHDIATGTDDGLHLAHLLADWGQGRPPDAATAR
jgi:replication factor C small subunit